MIFLAGGGWEGVMDFNTHLFGGGDCKMTQINTRGWGKGVQNGSEILYIFFNGP
jgi:hypothetical protein